jgi:hypothetical protein
MQRLSGNNAQVCEDPLDMIPSATMPLTRLAHHYSFDHLEAFVQVVQDRLCAPQVSYHAINLGCALEHSKHIGSLEGSSLSLKQTEETGGGVEVGGAAQHIAHRGERETVQVGSKK